MQQVFGCLLNILRAFLLPADPNISVYRFTTLTKEFAGLSSLKRHSFLPHMKVAELKHNVIYPISPNNCLCGSAASEVQYIYKMHNWPV